MNSRVLKFLRDFRNNNWYKDDAYATILGRCRKDIICSVEQPDSFKMVDD